MFKLENTHKLQKTNYKKINCTPMKTRKDGDRDTETRGLEEEKKLLLLLIINGKYTRANKFS